MKTQKPISTITYNTDAYLFDILESLIATKQISFYAFIKHQPEDDEGGGKEHIHLYIEPGRPIDTEQLREKMKEYDPKYPSKPLRPMPFRISKFQDWYLYGKHDPFYCEVKYLTKIFTYNDDDFVYSDFDYFLFNIRTIDMSEYYKEGKLIECAKNGLSWLEVIRYVSINKNQYRAYKDYYHDLLSSYIHEAEMKKINPDDSPF